MKKLLLILMPLLMLGLNACKNDKAAKETAEKDANIQLELENGNQEVPYVKVKVEELLGTYVDRNYPDKGFWKKVTISSVIADKVKVEFTAKDVNGKPGCSYQNTGDCKNGRIEIIMENKEGLADEAYTRMLLQKKEDGSLEVRAKGSAEDVQSILTLFCIINTSLGDFYTKLEE
jgi:hypothetical protein